jgi:hypothetical protein
MIYFSFLRLTIFRHYGVSLVNVRQEIMIEMLVAFISLKKRRLKFIPISKNVEI